MQRRKSFEFRSPMHRRAAVMTVVSLGLLLSLACQPDSPVQPGKNRAPTASIGGPNQGIEGTGITFDATGSRDPDGDTLTFAWDFGDGGNGTGPRPEHAFRDEGSYETTLIVSDARGASDTARATTLVANAPPVIALSIPPTPLPLGTPATIYVAFSDPGVLDSLTATVDWGDSTSSAIARGSSSHTYTAAGGYIVTVTVRDNDGAVSKKVAPGLIRISPPHTNHPPVATILGPSTIREGALAFFSAHESTDPDGDPLRYFWTFIGFPPYGGLSDSIVEQGHYYADEGVYTIRLIVIDSAGAQDTASTTLAVMNVPPQVSIFPPLQQAVGIAAIARFAVSDSGSQDKLTIAIRWGDGTRDSLTSSSERWNNTVIHTYAQPGSYWVGATVRDEDGGVDTATAKQPVIVIDPTERTSVAGYEVLDLGTLGGNSARPLDFNDYGKIVGSSLTASGRTHAFVWENGAMRDLGTLGHEDSEARRVNNAGVIAGTVWSGRYEGCCRNSFAAIWRNGTGTLLDSRGATGMPVSAVAINESADIAWIAQNHEHDFAWLFRDNRWERLGAIIPGSYSSVGAMNERRQIVGGSSAVSTGQSPEPIGHATVWEDGAVRDLGVLIFVPCSYYTDKNCGYSTASGINESGQIVGIATDADRSMHAVLWTNGAIRDLWKAPPFPNTEGGYVERVVINDVGQVAGSGSGEGFFWSNGTLHALGSLGGGSTSVADMNEAGAVVGTSRTTSGEQHAFVWTRERGMVDLGTGPHGLSAAWVVGISFFGDIAGFAASCDPADLPKCYPPQEVRAILWRRKG